MNRREWLAQFSSVPLLAQSPAQPTTAQPTTPPPTIAPPSSDDWYARPMRWAQVAFTEDDPGNYSAAFWLDYFQRIHADAACLSAGGVVAFYPTRIPLHYRSRFLGDTDPFGEMVAGCRKLGMNVIARIDPHACREDVLQAHPDWIARDAAGKPRPHWAAPDLYITCPHGPYNREFMTEVIREIVSLYRVDGVFANRWTGHGTCYCEHCQRSFQGHTGMVLTAEPADPVRFRQAYEEWREFSLFQCWTIWGHVIRDLNPNASFIANSGGGALSELSMPMVGAFSRILFADRQARRGLMPPWANGKNAKEYRAAMGYRPIGGIFSVGLEEPYRWKDSVQAEPEIRIWVADGIAHGLRPWFTKFNAKPIDTRWMPVVERIYNWHWKNERYLRNARSLARVAMLYSQPTARYYGGAQAQRKVEDPALGYYQAMVEARIPFDMVHHQSLHSLRTRDYQVLVLPNIAVLSDGQCRELEDYVAGGGSLVATFETSLYDEKGRHRSNFGLAKLFGCDFAGNIDARMQNSYLRLEQNPDGSFHPILRGLEGIPRIINGVGMVHTKPVGSPRAPLTLVPSYPDLPMEDVWARTPRTSIPMVYCQSYSKGRVVYFPMDLDRTFWEVLNGDHARLLQNAIHWAAGERQPLEVAGDGFLDVSYWRQQRSLAAHLVNLTNPMAMKGPYRQIFPVGPFQVSLALPPGTKPASVRLLEAGREARFQQQDGRLDVEVPRVEVHEVVAVDLA